MVFLLPNFKSILNLAKVLDMDNKL